MFETFCVAPLHINLGQHHRHHGRSFGMAVCHAYAPIGQKSKRYGNTVFKIKSVRLSGAFMARS